MAPVRIGMDQEEGELFPSRKRVIDVAARSAYETFCLSAPEEGPWPAWEILPEDVRIDWRKVVLAAAEVMDKQLGSVHVEIRRRGHRTTEEIESLAQLLERDA